MIRITPKILYNNFIFCKKIIAYDFCSDSNKNGSDKENDYLDNLEMFFKDNTINAEEQVETRIHKHVKPSTSVFKKKKETSYENGLFTEYSRRPNQNMQPSLLEILHSNTGIKKSVRKQNISPINKEIQHDSSIDLKDILKNNLNIKKFEKNEASRIDAFKSNIDSVSDDIQDILDKNSSISSQQQWEHTRHDQDRDLSEFDDIQGILDENISHKLDDRIIKDFSRSDQPLNQSTQEHSTVFSSETPQSRSRDLSSDDMESDQSGESIKSSSAVQSAQDGEELMQLLNNIDFHQVSRVFPVNISDTDYESFIDRTPSKRLDIFEKPQNEDVPHLEEECLNFLDVVESCEFRQLNTQVPPTQFHEWIQWTQDKKLWRFPIDNEQDSEELSVKFHEHVFPQQYLTGRLPKTGPIGQFMNYVCIGLSQSSHLTVDQKRAHIRWYEDYLASKVDECNIAMQKSKTN